MKKIVITGGSGFLGQALCKYFREQNWRVVILTRLPKTLMKSNGMAEPLVHGGSNSKGPKPSSISLANP
jgi:nucleoside-diphosphate-sugar epimerase